MTPEEFVEALRQVALLATVEGTVAVLEQPPGRRPKQELVEVSNWYRSRSEEGKAFLRRIMTMTADDAVFGVLAVLDGVRTIEDDPDKGAFRLIFKKGDQEWDLIDPTWEFLHDLLKAPDAK